MRKVLVLFFACMAIVPMTGQSDSAAEPDEPDPHLNWIGHLINIHADHLSESSSSGFYNSIKLEVIVTSAGRVEYAHAVEGPRELFSEAEAIEMERRFKPFHKNGKPVKALITDYVTVLPPEQWGAKEPFPDVKDWDSLRFTLERPGGRCLECPAYRLEIQGNGAVTFEGLNYVPSGKYHDEIAKHVISGKYRGKISRQQVEQLLEKFREADYFSLRVFYGPQAMDVETVNTSCTIDGNTKKVTDYDGVEVGMPEAVTGLETAMDQAAVAAFRAQGLNEQASKLEADIARRH